MKNISLPVPVNSNCLPSTTMLLKYQLKNQAISQGVAMNREREMPSDMTIGLQMRPQLDPVKVDSFLI